MRDSPTEKNTREARETKELGLAVWQGIKAFNDGLSIDDNPYTLDTKDLTSHQSLLWSRWAMGWFREHTREHDMR